MPGLGAGSMHGRMHRSTGADQKQQATLGPAMARSKACRMLGAALRAAPAEMAAAGQRRCLLHPAHLHCDSGAGGVSPAEHSAAGATAEGGAGQQSTGSAPAHPTRWAGQFCRATQPRTQRRAATGSAGACSACRQASPANLGADLNAQQVLRAVQPKTVQASVVAAAPAGAAPEAARVWEHGLRRGGMGRVVDVVVVCVWMGVWVGVGGWGGGPAGGRQQRLSAGTGTHPCAQQMEAPPRKGRNPSRAALSFSIKKNPKTSPCRPA